MSDSDEINMTIEPVEAIDDYDVTVDQQNNIAAPTALQKDGKQSDTDHQTKNKPSSRAKVTPTTELITSQVQESATPSQLFRNFCHENKFIGFSFPGIFRAHPESCRFGVTGVTVPKKYRQRQHPGQEPRAFGQ
jgi:hypothetical protein